MEHLSPTQKCSRCQQSKPPKDFLNEQGQPRKSCRRCQEHSRRTYEANPQRSIERAKKSQRGRPETIRAYKRAQNRKHPARYLHHQARTRARRKGITFDLLVEDVQVPAVCPVLGIPLQINDGCSGPDSPSLDRMDPNQGYVRGNVVVMSHKANTIKSNATLQELEQVVAFLAARTRKSPLPIQTETRNAEQRSDRFSDRPPSNNPKD